MENSHNSQNGFFSLFSSNHSIVYDSRLWERNHIVNVLLKKEGDQRKALAHCLRNFTLVYLFTQ